MPILSVTNRGQRSFESRRNNNNLYHENNEYNKLATANLPTCEILDKGFGFWYH